MISWSAARQSPTIDEPVHIASGIWHWTTGRFDLNRGNPPLVDMIAAIPVLFQDYEVNWDRKDYSFHLGEDFYEANGANSYWLTTTARWALLPFSVLGGFVCWLWARDLFGDTGGLLSLMLWCFCPMIIANAEIVTGDMTSTALIVSTCYLFWRWTAEPTWHRAVLTGCVFGLAQLAKFVAVLLYPILPAIWIASLVLKRNSPGRRPGIELTQLCCMILIGVDVTNTGYLFDGSGMPLATFDIGRDLLQLIGYDTPLLTSGFPANIPVPFPYDYVKGIDEIRNVSDMALRMYFDGVWDRGGKWEYFLVGFALKLPLGTVILVEATLLYIAYSSRFRSTIFNEFTLAFPLLGILVFVSSATTIQYLRYGLPVLPFLFVWVGRIGLTWAPTRNGLAWCTIACVVWAGLETCWFFPHSGSYFNQLAGGPENGHDYLLESSIDWGQDALYLKDWLEKNPKARPFHLAYFGHCDPRLAGVEFDLTPRISDLQNGGKLREGWYGVSVSLLRGFGWPVVPDGTGGLVNVTPNDYRYFLDLTPVDRIGYSINIYFLDQRTIEEVEQSLRSADL